VLIFFHFAGLIVNTPTHWFFTAIINPSSIQGSQLWIIVYAAISIVVGASLVIGTLWKSATKFIVKGALVLATITLVWDMASLWGRLAGDIGGQLGMFIASALISPFIILWFFALIDWW
jgi:hypothetical protein